MIDSKEKYIHFISGEKVGSGFLVALKNKDKDMVITARHCIDTEDDNIEFPDSKYFVEEKIILEDLDVACLIVKKTKCDDIDKYFYYDLIIEDSDEYLLCGYPALRRETEKKDMIFKLVYKGNKSGGCKFKIEEINELVTMNSDKKDLLDGMSGAPVILKRNNETFLVGMFNKSEFNNVEYNEINVISIKEIFEKLREEEYIYFKNGNLNDGIMYREADSGSEKELSALLIGKSGSGKSAFINSFLKHANLLDSSGDGQTTRTNIEYNIYERLSKEDKGIEIEFLTREKFVILRMEQIEKKLSEYISENETLKLNRLFKIITDIEGFFNYKEFDFENEKISASITSCFKEWFKDNIKVKYTTNEYNIFELKLKEYKEAKQEDNQCEEENLDEEKYDLKDVIELFYELIYFLIDKEIKIKKLSKKVNFDGQIIEKDRDYIQYILKLVDGENEKSLSYSSLVSKIIINDSVCDEYIELFKRKNIKRLQFIDTYGLDHNEELKESNLLKRLLKLFEDYQKIESVFYIRKLNSDSPTDIETTMNALYTANPSVTLYVIFSEIDKNEKVLDEYERKTIIDLREMNKENKIKAVDYFMEDENEDEDLKEEHLIKQKMVADGVSEQLVNSIYDVLINNLSPYCSALQKNIRYKFIKNNIFHLEKLFKSIIDKEYLGEEIVNFKRIEENIISVDIKIEETLKRIFILAKIDDWYKRGNWKTYKANIDRIKRGELGYWGTYCDTWNSRFSHAYNEVFSKLSDKDFLELINIDPKMKQAVPIMKLLNSFSREFIGCKKYKYAKFENSKICGDCKYSNECFKEILMKSYKENDFNRVDSRQGWLTYICNFEDRLDSIIEELKKVFRKKFLEFFESECRIHNNRIITMKVKNECNIELDKIKSVIKEYNKEISEVQVAEIISSCMKRDE